MHRTNNICFHCHRIERNGHDGSCPECGKPMVNVGYRWRAPKKGQKKAWKEFAALLANTNPYFRAKLVAAGVVAGDPRVNVTVDVEKECRKPEKTGILDGTAATSSPTGAVIARVLVNGQEHEIRHLREMSFWKEARCGGSRFFFDVRTGTGAKIASASYRRGK